jgi:hypothetical protein
MTCQKWRLIKLLALFAAASASTAPASAAPLPQVTDGMPHESALCSWPTLTGEALLKRRIGAVELARASLNGDLLPLLRRRQVPISFIAADRDSTVALHLTNPTLQEVLDNIVTQAPAYHYEFLRGHLVLYPRNSPYQQSLAGFTLPSTARSIAAYLLVLELRKRYSIFADLVQPGIIGNAEHFLYQDTVAISGAATVLDGLVQLLGNRPSALFAAVHLQWGPPVLQLHSAEQVQAIALKPAFTSLVVGETVQLKVTANLVGGDSQDVTLAACGTTYVADNGKVVIVDKNGLLRTLAPGAVEVWVHNELQASALIFKVEAAKTITGKAPLLNEARRGLKQ